MKQLMQLKKDILLIIGDVPYLVKIHYILTAHKRLDVHIIYTMTNTAANYNIFFQLFLQVVKSGITSLAGHLIYAKFVNMHL